MMMMMMMMMLYKSGYIFIEKVNYFSEIHHEFVCGMFFKLISFS